MNLNKSKDKVRYSKVKENNPGYHKAFSYDIKQDHHDKQYSQKAKNRTKYPYQHEIQMKQKQQFFKNMQKCNQKMEYYKLMGSLEQQKRTMLQQQNYFLKQQNEKMKKQIQTYKKQVNKLAKKLDKAYEQIQKYESILASKQNQFMIKIPQKSSKNQSKTNKSSPKTYDQEQVQLCNQCIQLSQKLEQERDLYERDRRYLKQQIDHLNQFIEEAQEKQKLATKQLEGRNSFNQRKQIQILEKYKYKENALKKQLTLCYKAYEEKCNLVSDLQQKIDFFQQQNKRILELLKIFDGYNLHNNAFTKKLNSQPPRRQQRARSSYNVKDKNYKYSALYNDSFDDMVTYGHTLIQNRSRNRKCGSIKKIQVE